MKNTQRQWSNIRFSLPPPKFSNWFIPGNISLEWHPLVIFQVILLSSSPSKSVITTAIKRTCHRYRRIDLIIMKNLSWLSSGQRPSVLHVIVVVILTQVMSHELVVENIYKWSIAFVFDSFMAFFNDTDSTTLILESQSSTTSLSKGYTLLLREMERQETFERTHQTWTNWVK